MALFDNDFIETIVTEGKDCDKDCKKGKDVEDEKEEKEDEDVKDEEEVEDADEELSDEDKEEAEESARFDVEEASSIESMKGIEHPVYEMSCDAHATCLEFMGTTIALDKVDVACTESYVKAVTEAEKEAVTSKFKENVKKYYAKFKAFIMKIKNIVVRAYNRVKNYAVNFMTNVMKKIKTRKVTSLDTAAMAQSDKKISTYAHITEDFSKLAERVEKYINEQTGFAVIAQKAISLGADASEEECNEIQKQISETKAPSKDQIREAILGAKTEVAPSEFKDALTQLNALGVLKKNPFEGYQKVVMEVIKKTEGSVSASKDLNSKVIATKVALINRAVTYANRVWAVLGTLMHHWVSARVSVIGKFGKGAAKEEAKPEVEKNSWTMLDSFEAEW